MCGVSPGEPPVSRGETKGREDDDVRGQAVGEIEAQGWKITEHVEEDARHAARFGYRKHALTLDTIEWVKSDGRWRCADPDARRRGDPGARRGGSSGRRVTAEALKALAAAKASSPGRRARVSQGPTRKLPRGFWRPA